MADTINIDTVKNDINVMYGKEADRNTSTNKGLKVKKGEVYLCQKEMLAVLGTAETLGAAPYESKDFEIWGCAVVATYPTCKRWDLLFELHTEGYWKDKNVKARLKSELVPMYMHEKYKDIPMSMRFPVEIITKAYRRYHTTTISYMLALAYHSFKTTGKPKHMALFGIHMAAREEYTEQRPCCEYWLGACEGAGMDIELAPGGALLISQGLYGYENYDPVCFEYRKRMEGLQMGLTQANSEIERWNFQKGKQIGAIEEDEHWLRRFQRGELKQ